MRGCWCLIRRSQAWMKRNVAAPVCVPPLSDAVSAAVWLSLHAPNCTARPPLVPLYFLHSHSHSSQQAPRAPACPTPGPAATACGH